MNTHSCIKCKAQYQSEDEDAYYCDPCNVERLEIAKKIDATIGSRPQKKHMSMIQQYDASPKVHGFLQVKL